MSERALRPAWVAIVALSLLTVGFVTAMPAAAEEDCEAADVSVEDDACGEVVAVTATGDARGEDCKRAVSCVTVSGTGNATNQADDECGSGDDEIGPDPQANCIAVSGTGDASNEGVCGEEFASGEVSVYVTCISVSGTGDASNTGRGCGEAFGRSGVVVIVACVSSSGTGDSSNREKAGNGCGYAGDFAVSVGCVSVSGTGNATTSSQNGFISQECGAHNGLGGYAVGCLAVSGTGEAEAKNCDFRVSAPPHFPILIFSPDAAIAVGCFAVDGETPRELAAFACFTLPDVCDLVGLVCEAETGACEALAG